MRDYTTSSYGDAFADVYDDWYRGLDDAEATADVVAHLARRSAAGREPARVLELGVGTGRLAVPMAARGLAVHGVDASAAMVERLRRRSPLVAVTTGDMVVDQPPGPFDAVVVAYNTLFNLETAERQRACFAAVAGRLAPRGSFVVDVFVPEDPPRRGSRVDVRSMTAGEVVLSVSIHDPDAQRAEGQFVELTDGAPVRLRPWSIRYCAPAELDAMAAAAGLVLHERWEDFTGRTFTPDSPRHVSVYGPPSAHGPHTGPMVVS